MLKPHSMPLKSSTRKASLSMECLESRELMAAGIWSVDQTLFIQTTNGGDTVLIQESTGPDNDWNTVYDNELIITWTHGGSTEVAKYKRFEYQRQGDKLVPVPVFTKLDINGGLGNDTITNETDLPSFIRGHNGADKLTGGFGKDVIYGGRGSDIIYGGIDDDILYANSPEWKGSELVVDQLFGEQGNDKLYGARKATNILHGGTQDDILYGGDLGNNQLYGDEGGDTMYGGMGKKGNIGLTANLFTDTNGQDVFWGGDYARNTYRCRDGYPEIFADTIHLGYDGSSMVFGYQGVDKFFIDPLLKYNYNHTYFGDRVLGKFQPGFIQTDGGYLVNKVYDLD